MTRVIARYFVLAALLLTLVGGAYGPTDTLTVEVAQASPIASRSFFGMNLYITGLERPQDEKYRLLDEAAGIGVKWSREEISWANVEREAKGTFGWRVYDPWIDELRKRNINVIGALQTTPSWASGVPMDAPDWYWHVPRNPQDFVDFAAEAAAHYRGKIDVWEIWNEPDVDITFRCNGCDTAKHYAQMLTGSYAAIKRANPQAIVLIGGLSIHDTNNAGMAFLNRVVAASGGKLNFDVLSIHPYMPDRHPESTDPKTVVQNFQYRLDMSLKWLRDHGGGDKEIWITEHGYSTCNPCGTLGVSEEEQARRLVRLHAIAMASPNVTHFAYFQMKDKFNAPSTDLWGNMGIMRNDLSPKPALAAYRVMTRQLEGTTFLSQGSLMRQVPNRWQPQWDRYHYRFGRSGSLINVLWKLGAPEVAAVPVSRPNVTVIDSRGNKLDAALRNNAVQVTLSEDPIYVIEPTGANTGALDPSLDANSPTGLRPSARFADYWSRRGGLPLFGYPISSERLEKSPTDGKEYVVQWFERARFEYHPEYAGTDAEVLLGLLGSQLVAGRTFPTIPPPQGVERFCSEATKHCIWGRFLERWRALGLAQIGLPLSDQFEERSPTEGKTYVVQYFERARFEYHPENKPPFDVLLGLLGRQLYKP
jgi:hypothetical protein